MKKLCFACCLTMFMFTQTVCAQTKAEEGKPKEEPKPKFRKTGRNSYEMDERLDVINGLVRLGYYSTQTKKERDTGIENALKAKPSNGMSLQIELTYEPGDKPKDDAIVFEWALGYTGKSLPRTIVKPSLFNRVSTKEELQVWFLAEGQDGIVYWISYKNYDFLAENELGGEPTRAKDEFVTIQDDKSTSKGKLKIPLEMLLRDLNEIAPKQFDHDKCPYMHASLVFQPEDRGEFYNMDAWTGRLHSNVGILSVKPRIKK